MYSNLNAKNGIRNILSNFISQFFTILLGLLIPRLVLVNLGSEANGLLTSVNQLLAYLALLEAGVGTASIQALYKPIANNDKQSISQIMAATHHYYKRTGFLYFCSVVVLSLVFPLTFQSSLPPHTIMLVLFLSGLPGVVNYYFQGKFRILLQAEGKAYILTSLYTVVHILTNLTKIFLLLNGFDVVALQAMYFLYSILQMAFIVVYIKRHYKWLDLSVKPDYDAISQSKNAMVHQISGFIFSNTDALLLTFFCGLSTVSVYSMYAMLFGIVATMITNFSGANFIIGQTYHIDFERYLKLHDLYELYNMTLTFSLYCITNIFILPFMRLYTAGIADTTYIDTFLPYLFITTYLLSNGRSAACQAVNHAGHFKQTQWRAILESAINIFVSVLCVQKFGIYGVLFGTIAAMLYRTNDFILYANKKILHRSPWITYRRWLLNLALFILVTIISKQIFAHVALDSYFSIIVCAALSCIVILPIFFITVSLFDLNTARYASSLLLPYAKMLRARLKLK